MNKKLIILFLMSVFLFSCGNGEDETDNGYEIAVLIDLGPVDDRSFNQGSWEGAKEYGEKNGITHKYYKVPDKDLTSYMNTVELAVTGGAKLIVTPGYMFEPVVYKAQDMYTNINFILIDGTPQDGTYSNYKTADNTIAILYAEEEAGFLAGYAVVKEGYTNLGVMAGMAVPAVMRFGYGFLQGANYAAKEMNMPVGAINANYTYLGNFDPTPENQTLANSWYQSGIQVIFAPAGGAGNSVMSAAEQNNALVVGVDIDQSTESSTVITSAMKMLGESVYNAIDDFYNGKFPGGKSVILDAKVNGIGLPMETSRFQKFNQNDYDTIYQKLVAGEIQVLTEKTIKDVTYLPLDIVKVNFIQ